MACLRKKKLKEGFVWVVDYTFEGKRCIKSTKTTDTDLARRILKDIEGRIARGAFDLERYDKKHVLLEPFFKEYFEYAKSFKAAKTIENETHCAKQFVSRFGNVSLRTLNNPRLLDKWKASMLQRINPTTFNIHHRFLHAAFNVAIKWGYLEKNPMETVSKERAQEKRLFMTKEEFGRVIQLTEEDAATTKVDSRRKFLKYFHLLLVFLVNTGLRRREAIRLTAADIDLKKRLLHIVHTKSKRVHIIPLNETAFRALEDAGPQLFSQLDMEMASRYFANL